MLRKVLAPVALLAVTVAALPAQNESLEEVLEGYYETVGGEEAWQQVETLKIEGRMTLGPNMEAPFTVWNKRPRMSRVDFTFQGVTGTQAFDGETGWMIMPFMGNPNPEPMPDDQAAVMWEDSDVDGPLIGWQEEGTELELMGTEEVEGTPAHKLKLTLENGQERFLYLDADYYLPIRIEGTRQMQGQTVEFFATMGDYKPVDGLLMAHSVESGATNMPPGQRQVMTIDTVIVNPEVPEGIFEMPESEESEGDDGGN